MFRKIVATLVAVTFAFALTTGTVGCGKGKPAGTKKTTKKSEPKKTEPKKTESKKSEKK